MTRPHRHILDSRKCMTIEGFSACHILNGVPARESSLRDTLRVFDRHVEHGEVRQHLPASSPPSSPTQVRTQRLIHFFQVPYEKAL
ncbi:hypothetical protein PGT21_007615 [Puccinia graminis f. sp. tritici]|uniref:Uncharacterized protein n=1 Tax=Puccinia graminis f. sp. tritici TaxID=56615 RepID=A0A5B0LKE3_PUCGR|nr:hypothetical protein PGT21_007615 [Puccinia graminis f. sp. tritici]